MKQNFYPMRKIFTGQTIVFILLTATVILLTQNYFFSIPLLKRVESNLIDLRFRERGQLQFKGSSDVIIVSISQESSKALPPPFNKWPWPRSIYARMIKNLNQAGVKAIGIDLIMSDPDRLSASDDTLLLNTIRKYGNVVVAGEVKEENNGGENSGDYFKERYIYNKNFNFNNIFFKADSSIGIVNVLQDNDGVIRKYSPVWRLPFQPPRDVPSFAFAVLNKYYGYPYYKTVDETRNDFIYQKHIIPKYDASSFLINYYGPSGTFPEEDITDIIDDSTFETEDEKNLGTQINLWDDPKTGLLYSGIFKNKIVLVGSFDPLEKDYFNVSYSSKNENGGNVMFGVEVYANIIQSILDNNFLSKEPATLGIIMILLFSFFSFYSRTLFKKAFTVNTIITEIINLFFAAVLVFIVYQISFYLFDHFNYVASISGPEIAIVFGYIGSTTYNFITERKRSTLLKKMFSQYVNSNLLDELILNPSSLKLGGERKELTVFFSDIAGFTSISENKDSEELVSLLNEYFTEMTRIILEHKGTLDKFLGDAVMAFWGAPVPVQNHALECCTAALRMTKKLNELKLKWEKEHQPVFSIRIGINTGEMIVGNMGGKERFDYTVIGDNVNLASRLEGVNKEYGSTIIISESTYDYVKDILFVRELDFILVKGKSKPVRIYELIAPKSETVPDKRLKLIKFFEEGLEKYRQRDFEKAKELFENAIELDANDGPSSVYLKRCIEFQAAPPPAGWNGTFIMTHK